MTTDNHLTIIPSSHAINTKSQIFSSIDTEHPISTIHKPPATTRRHNTENQWLMRSSSNTTGVIQAHNRGDFPARILFNNRLTVNNGESDTGIEIGQGEMASME